MREMMVGKLRGGVEFAVGEIQSPIGGVVIEVTVSSLVRRLIPGGNGGIVSQPIGKDLLEFALERGG